MKKLIIAISCLSLGMMALPAQAQDKLTFSAPIGHPLVEPVLTILREAYKSLNIEIGIVELPAARALLVSNSGGLDGELGRIAGIEESYDNLRSVPVPIWIIEGTAFSLDKLPPITGWSSLAPYKIGMLRGTIYAENATRDMQRIMVNKPEQVFELLLKNRVDIGIMEKFVGINTIKKMGISEIKVWEPPLARYPIFHYLHKRHVRLIAALTNSLKKTLKTKKVKQIKRQFMSAQTNYTP